MQYSPKKLVILALAARLLLPRYYMMSYLLANPVTHGPQLLRGVAHVQRLLGASFHI